jgi:hypothetical protein
MRAVLKSLHSTDIADVENYLPNEENAVQKACAECSANRPNTARSSSNIQLSGSIPIRSFTA